MNEEGVSFKVKEFLILARDAFAATNARAAMERKIDAVTWIFYAKNYFEMQDKTEIVLEPHNSMGELKDPEEIRRRMIEGVVED
jgi:hypothetical protein